MKKVQFKTKETISSDEKVRMTITQNKQVGIGTENPSQTIDVSGSLSVNDSIKKNGSDLYNLSSKELKDLSGVDYQTPSEGQIFSWKDASNVWGAQTIEKTWSTKQDETGTILTYNVADSNVAIGKNMASNWEVWDYNQEITEASGNSFQGQREAIWGENKSFSTYGNTLVTRTKHVDNVKIFIFEINGGTIELKQTISCSTTQYGNLVIYGDYIAIGDFYNHNTVKIYKKTNGVWDTNPHQTITGNGTGTGNEFAKNFAISDKWLAVTESYILNQNKSNNIVHFYKKDNTGQFVAHVVDNNLTTNDYYLGKVVIDGDTVYIGAKRQNSSNHEGSIYIYDLTESGYSKRNYTTANSSSNNSGNALTVSYRFIVSNQDIYYANFSGTPSIFILKPDNSTSPPTYPNNLREEIENELFNNDSEFHSDLRHADIMILDRFMCVTLRGHNIQHYPSPMRKILLYELINENWVQIKKIEISANFATSSGGIGDIAANIVKEQDDYYLVILNEKSIGIDSTYMGTGKLILYKLTKHHYIQDVSGNSNISNELHIGEKLGVGNNIVPEYPLHVDGTTFSSTSWSTSDDRVKHNEQSIDGALDTIDKLEPKHYIKTQKMYDASHNFTLNSSGNPVKDNGELLTDYTRETGLIAQEVKDIPELAFAVKDGAPMSVDYNSIHCTHIAATKELNTKIEALKAKNTALEEENTQMEQDLQNIKQHLGI